MRRCLPAALILLPFSVLFSPPSASAAPPPGTFYLPENPKYTIADSALDSVRFTVDKTFRRDDHGHFVSTSSFVNPDADIMWWHDFGPLEGPGWAANAVGGAFEIHWMGTVFKRPAWQKAAIDIVDHILEDGFLQEDGLIRAYWHDRRCARYKNCQTDKFCLNYAHNSDWLCPGSMAKVATQMLLLSDRLEDGSRKEKLRTAAKRCAEWLLKNVERTENGWYPRRVFPDGKIHRKNPRGGDDVFWQTSADGIFIPQLLLGLTERGLGDHTEEVRRACGTFVKLGGVFGSINHDTYDPNENAAYSCAFRVLRAAAAHLKDEAMRKFAYDVCLAGLETFKMHEDRNGVATKGLLWMERSWDTSYLWENAEAALAHFEAAAETGDRKYSRDGLTILRAAAKHHHGPHGFLTEGIDWNNHVHERHHVGGAYFGDIQYTEPFLNGQHITEPTLFYLERLAKRETDAETKAVKYVDEEGNVLATVK